MEIPAVINIRPYLGMPIYGHIVSVTVVSELLHPLGRCCFFPLGCLIGNNNNKIIRQEGHGYLYWNLEKALVTANKFYNVLLSHSLSPALVRHPHLSSTPHHFTLLYLPYPRRLQLFNPSSNPSSLLCRATACLLHLEAAQHHHFTHYHFGEAGFSNSETWRSPDSNTLSAMSPFTISA